MRIFTPVALATLALSLTACSGGSPETAPEPTPEPTPLYIPNATPEQESEYLSHGYDGLPERYHSAENRAAAIEFGHSLCELAAEGGTTTGQIASEHIDTLDASAEDWNFQLSLTLLQGKYAGEVFCPEYAGEAIAD